MNTLTASVSIDAEFRALIPPLRPEELAQLEANILADGVRDPLVTWRGVLVDGHNRYAIATTHGLAFQVVERAFATRDDVVLWIVNNQFGRRNLSIAARTELAMRIEPILAAKARANMAAAGAKSAPGRPAEKGRQISDDLTTVSTKHEAAKLAGVSHDTYHKAKTVLRTATPEIVEKYRAGEMTTNQAYQHIRREEKEARREERRSDNAAKIAHVSDPLQIVATRAAKFATIVIDPPWDWGDEGDADQMGRARPTYQTMPLDDVLALPVREMADVDAHCYLWITNRSLPKGFALLEAWGFRYVTCLTWVKPSFGLGNYFRGQTEQVLFGVRGSQPLKRHDVGTVFHAARGSGGHSSKPDAFYALVESCSPGPYLEMFSRRLRDGWMSWGEVSNAA